MKSLHAMQVYLFLTLFAIAVRSQPERRQFTICSRVVTIIESEDQVPTLNDDGPIDLLGCSASVDQEDTNSELSSCTTSSFKTRPNSSAFVREIRIGEAEGSLRAFALEDITVDSSSSQLCFQHDLPRGGSELADDSPRCMDNESGVFYLFLTRQCEKEVCRMSYLALTSHNCATQSDVKESVSPPKTEIISPSTELEE